MDEIIIALSKVPKPRFRSINDASLESEPDTMIGIHDIQQIKPLGLSIDENAKISTKVLPYDSNVLARVKLNSITNDRLSA